MFNILLFGPPGAGKGTQADLLKAHYGLDHISTGWVIRREIEAGSPMGQRIESYVVHGELAPDHLLIDLIAHYVREHREEAGIIFDGFPRTTAQAEAFDEIMTGYGLSVDVMLSLEVPDDMLIKRIVKRAETSGRPDDADEEVIRRRIDVYKSQTRVVGDYYAQQGKYLAIDGTGTIEEVFENIRKEIDDKYKVLTTKY